MDTRKRWRRAIIISVALNILLLCGVGILWTGFLRIDSVEPLIELDLVSDYRSKQLVDSGQGQVNVSPVAQMVLANNATVLAPVTVQTIDSLSIDEVSTADGAKEAKIPSSPISGSIAGVNDISGKAANGVASNGGQSAEKLSGGILSPQIVSQVQPIYPEATRQAGITGTVLLKVQILENGRAGGVSIKQSSGNNLLDESAVAAVYKWLFTPAKEKNTGRAVVSYTTVPVVFRLN